jgi:hypothetical protein
VIPGAGFTRQSRFLVSDSTFTLCSFTLSLLVISHHMGEHLPWQILNCKGVWELEIFFWLFNLSFWGSTQKRVWSEKPPSLSTALYWYFPAILVSLPHPLLCTQECSNLRSCPLQFFLLPSRTYIYFSSWRMLSWHHFLYSFYTMPYNKMSYLLDVKKNVYDKAHKRKLSYHSNKEGF